METTKHVVLTELTDLIKLVKKNEVREFTLSWNGNAVELAVKTK
jgi:hypothetical protein